MLLTALSCVLVGATLVWWLKARPAELPGGLEAEGLYEATVDLEDAATVEERRRDFVRVASSAECLLVSRDGSSPRPVALGRGPRGSWDDCVRLLEGSRDAWVGDELSVLSRTAFAFVSATTPFEWAQHFGVTPHFGDSRYVLVRSGDRRTLRVVLRGPGQHKGASAVTLSTSGVV